jgi:HAD superfamily hydrolase (TIGR01509 family)
MTKAIIFDLYGVLALNGWQAFKELHFSDRLDVWEQVFELGKQVDAGLKSYDDLVQFTAEQTGQSQAVVRHQLEHTVANEPLLDYIRITLKPHYKIGILSNAGTNVVERIFTAEQQDLFDAVVLSHHVGYTKPQFEMYDVIANRLETDLADCLFIDDQERHVTGARDAGMQALVYTDVMQLQSQLKTLL